MEKTLRATHQGELVIGDKTLPCAVLEDGTRLIRTNAVFKVFNRVQRSNARLINVPAFIDAQNLQRYIDKELRHLIKPRDFVSLSGSVQQGYDANILPALCDVYLKARTDNVLGEKQKPLALQAEIIVRSLAKVGITALVDEATGYQEVRDRIALQRILERYLLEEYQKVWSKRFPNEFYEEMFRLKGWQWNNLSVARPGVVGTYTNDIIYKRLAPEVLKEIQNKNKKLQEDGQGKVHQHRWLTLDTGIPALDRHIHAIIALMRASGNWRDFMRLVVRSFPTPESPDSLFYIPPIGENKTVN